MFRFFVQAEGTASPFNSTSLGVNGASVKNADQAKTELSRTQSKVWKTLPFPYPVQSSDGVAPFSIHVVPLFDTFPAVV